MWVLPRPGIQPTSLALAGGFLPTEPSGDTDDIGYFPLFYDVFHFLIQSSHGTVFSSAFEYMQTAEFQSRMEETCRKLGLDHSGNVTDLYARWVTVFSA